VQRNFSGKTYRTAELNGNIRLDSYLLVKPVACNTDNDCKSPFLDNANHQYKYYINIRPTFTPTTCTFNDQEIDIPSIRYQDLDKSDYLYPTSDQPKLQCNSTLGVATSNISYHFEAISSPIGSILQNELGTEPGSAGEVGFLLMNHGQNITAYPSQKFNLARFGEALQNISSVQLDLKARYASYGNKVYSGRVQSKVKVVVDYD